MQEDWNVNKPCHAARKKKNWTMPVVISILALLLAAYCLNAWHRERQVAEISENGMRLSRNAEVTELARPEAHILNGDYREAKRLLENAASKGNAEAKAMLGSMYVFGQGMAADAQKGLVMLEEAAEEGSAYAKSTLGNWYVRGEQGLTKNIGKGLTLIDEASGSGEYYRYVAKARLYEDGVGVEKDSDKAISYFREAAEHGYSDAESHIAEIIKKPRYETTAKLYATEYSIPDYKKEKYIGQKVRLSGQVKAITTADNDSDIAVVELDTGGNPYTIAASVVKSEKNHAFALNKGEKVTLQGIGAGHTGKIIRLNDSWFPDE